MKFNIILLICVTFIMACGNSETNVSDQNADSTSTSSSESTLDRNEGLGVASDRKSNASQRVYAPEEMKKEEELQEFNPEFTEIFDERPTSAIDWLMRKNNFRFFTSLIKKSKHNQLLQDRKGGYTILAIPDEAFEQIGEMSRNQIQNDVSLINKLIGSHIIPGAYTVESLDSKRSFKDLNGQEVKIGVFDQRFTFNNMYNMGDCIHTQDGFIYPVLGVAGYWTPIDVKDSAE